MKKKRELTAEESDAKYDNTQYLKEAVAYQERVLSSLGALLEALKELRDEEPKEQTPEREAKRAKLIEELKILTKE